MGCAVCLRISQVGLRAPFAVVSSARVPLRFLALLCVVCCLGAMPVWAVQAIASVTGAATGGGGGGGAYTYEFTLHYSLADTTAVWRLPVRDPEDLWGIWAPGTAGSTPAWVWTMLARPSAGWDPSVWDPTQAMVYAKVGAEDLANAPFLLAFSGPTSTALGTGGFGFLSDLSSVSAPGNATFAGGSGESTRYFDPPTPNGLTPEPGCVGLLALAGCIVLLRRRRHA